MKRLWFVLVLLSSALALRAQSAPDNPPPADDGEWTTEVMPADVSVKIVSPAKPTATIAAPKKGKSKAKAVKTAKGKPQVKAAAPTAPPEPAAASKSSPVPAVPLTPIAPRNP